jgi:hypothetical protein
MCPPPHRLSLLENTAHQVGKLFKKDKWEEEKKAPKKTQKQLRH